MVESRFRTPDATRLRDVVHAALTGRRHDESTWRIIEAGSQNVVVLTVDAAVRVTRDPGGADALRRAQTLVDALPDLPFDVPRSLGPLVEHEGLAAVATARIAGEPHPSGRGHATVLRGLLDAVRAIDVDALRPWLAPARSFCGGPEWASVLREHVIPLLPIEVRAEAGRRVDALVGLATTPSALVHGDLAGANVLWRDGAVAGVLDWDLAAVDDPAIDVAGLVAWHGWELLPHVTDAETARRADVHRRTFPLQVVAFSLLHDRPPSELDRAIARAAERLCAAA